jgi:hypothetical protein
MDLASTDSSDPRDEIVHLEARIEELAASIEICRKFMLASRLAIVLGAILLAAVMLGAIPFDSLAMTAAIAALLGGVVTLGSNSSTAKEASAQLAAAEAERAELIGSIELHVVGDRDCLH